MLSSLLTSLVILASTAHAEEQDLTLDIEKFQPFSDAYGYFGVPSASTLANLQVASSLWAHYSNDSLVLFDADTGERTAPASADIQGDDGDGVVDFTELSTGLSVLCCCF